MGILIQYCSHVDCKVIRPSHCLVDITTDSSSYIINLVTTLSISAISTNGTVRGGGAYYLISRSLGPEFGGSIGVVFYLGSVFNTGMNAVGLVDCILNNYGEDGGNNRQLLPESFVSTLYMLWFDELTI